MAQTITSVNACDVDIRLDNDAGTPVWISGSSNTVEMEFGQELQAYWTMYAGRMPKRNSTREDAAIGLTVVYSTATDEAIDLLTDWYFNYPNTARTLTVYIPSYSIGADTYSGEVLLERFNIPAESEESAPITVQAVLLPTGAWTKATKAT
jgi:hypothetical protein